MTPEDYAGARELFHELFELDEEERARRIAERDPPAGVREALDLLLRHDGHGEELGRASPGQLAEVLLGEPRSAPSGPARVGDYRILRLLGEGGMGVVYEARRPTDEGSVALKVLRAGVDTDSHLRRFAREAAVLRDLRHEGIAAFRDAGYAPLGDEGEERPFLAMELVEGRHLLEHARAGDLGLPARLELLLRVCEAVQYAHEEGVVHRDLKPSNVLVVREEGGIGRPKVLDFGVARLAPEAAGAGPWFDTSRGTQTATGSVIGTLPYMSPEQVAGGARRLDARSDLYSLAVLGYELIAGHLPYEVRGLPLLEAARVIQEAEPRPIANLDARRGPSLDRVLRKALEKERWRRFADVAEFAAELRRIRDGEPVRTRPVGWWRATRKLVGRHKVLAAGVGGTLVALTIGLVAVSFFAVAESRARHEADRNAARAEDSAAQAEDSAYRAGIAAASAALDAGSPDTARRLLDEAPAHRRGWEWSHLRARLDDSLARLPVSHREFERQISMAFDVRDGALVFAGEGPAGNGRVHRWNWATGAGAELREFPGTLERPALSRDGTRQLRAFKTRVLLEDTKDGKVLASRDTPASTASKLTLSEDGSRAWYRAGDELFGWVPAEDRRVPLGRIHAREAIRSSGDGRFAIVVDQAVARWFEMDGGSEAELVEFGGRTNARVLSPDGTHVAWVPSEQLVVEVASLDGAGPLRSRATYHGYEEDLRGLDFSPDGTRIAAAGDARDIHLWRWRDGRVEARLLGHSEQVRRVQFSSDGRTLASYAGDRGPEGEFAIWSTEPDRGRVLPTEALQFACAFSIDGQRLYCGGFSGEVRAFDVASGACIARLALAEAPRRRVHTLGSALGGKFLGRGQFDQDRPVGGRYELLDLVDPSGTRTVYEWEGSHFSLGCVDPSGQRLAIHIDADGILLFDLRTGERLARVESEALTGRPAWWTEGRVAHADGEEEVAIRDGRNLRLLRRLDVGRGRVQEIVGDAQGRFLAVATQGRAVVLWDFSEEPPRRRDLEHSAGVRAVAFSPDGRRLFTGGGDRVLHVWDPESGKEVVGLSGHSNVIRAIAVSPDGDTVASASLDRSVRLHGVRTVREQWQAAEERGELVARWRPRLEERLARGESARAIESSLRAASERSDRESEVASQVLLALQWDPESLRD